MITTPQEYGYRIQLLNMAHAAHAACNCNWATKSSAVMPRASWRFSWHQVPRKPQEIHRNTMNYYLNYQQNPMCLSHFHHPNMDDFTVQDVVKFQRWVPSCWLCLVREIRMLLKSPSASKVGPVGTAAAPLSATQPSASGTRGLGVREKLTKKIPICCAVYVLVSFSIENSQAFVGSQSEVWNKATGKTGKTCRVFRGPNGQHHIRGLMCQGHSCGR